MSWSSASQQPLSGEMASSPIPPVLENGAKLVITSQSSDHLETDKTDQSPPDLSCPLIISSQWTPVINGPHVPHLSAPPGCVEIATEAASQPVCLDDFIPVGLDLGCGCQYVL